MMLSLRRHGYKADDLKLLREVLVAGLIEIECPQDAYCECCPRRLVCNDLTRLINHIGELIYQSNSKEVE